MSDFVPDPPVEPRDILDTPLREFIAQTGSRCPTPGGGSVAAVAGALSAALAEMALRYTVTRKAAAPHRDELAREIDKFRQTAGLMQDLVAEDMHAYARLSELLKLPEEERPRHPEFEAAVVAAIRAPQSVAGLAHYILERCYAVLEKCSPYLLSDLGVAAAYAHATVDAAELNVMVNLRLLASRADALQKRKELDELALKSDTLYRKIRAHTHEHL
jgi:formiminotetrahydrofolate cyclodeaminase